MFGKLTPSDQISKGFLFLYDYLFCTSVEIREATLINNGFKEALYYKNHLILLGYRVETEDVVNDFRYREIVSILQLEAELTEKQFLKLKHDGN